MKHFRTTLLLSSILFALSAEAALTNGTYTTEAPGNNGPVVFETDIKDGRISDIRVVASGETPGLGDAALETLRKAVIARQSLKIDAVSGASNSSRAVFTAVRAALLKAGGSEADLKAVAIDKDKPALLPDVTTDVVVVGAGASGLAAAIEATNSGARVILIEKLSFVGGTSLLASTAFNAGGSKVQLANKEKPYTVDDYYQKLLKGAQGQELANLRQLAELSAPTADWLMSLGADMGRVINGSQHTPTKGGAFGAMLIPVLHKEARRLSIDTRTNTKATELIQSETGEIIGVSVETPKGNYKITADAVILATGGFASNPDLVKRFSPQWAGYPSTASVGATGDGILMAEKAGAALSQLSLTGPQTVAYDTGSGAVSLTAVRYNGAIIVNRDGVRFTNELGNTGVIGKAITRQKDGVGFLVIDQAGIDRAALMETYKKRGYFVEADTPEALAEKLGINAKSLAKSLADWQIVYDTKVDKAFGRKDSIFSRLDRAPYYGQKISPASQTTYGGVLRDDKARAVGTNGKVIPGLYVSGETASQYGQGLTIAVVLGRLAGQNAALEAVKK